MGGGGKTTEYQKTDPWAPQQPYLLDAFSEAKGIYDSKKDSRGYTGDFVASYDPTDVAGLKSIRDWSMTTGQNLVNTQAAGGQDLFSRGSQALGEVDTGLKDFANRDWTSTHIANANRYADNPYISDMVDATTRDAVRTFNEDTIRGINQNAAATGNGLSTRAGIAAGVAQRGIADLVGDTSAKLRSDAYNAGLQMSQGDQQSLLAALMGRGELASGMTSQGHTMMNDALSNEAGVLGLQSSIAELLKANEQSKLDNKFAKFDYRDNYKSNLLSQYYNVVGDKLWGSEGFSQTKTQPSALSTAGSIIGAIGSLFKSDARTKDIIEKVGHTTEGLPLYRYTYKDAKHLGEFTAPLAQDVQKIKPEAVQEVNGVLYIDTNLYDWR
ncbi:hypothetical protein GGR34_000734 [Microvirga flocculans]|uniref:Peptidase S74 domain-containing protein n=1 Tax=Microvirga flocculans TaxID=217168 RepID=A0A7W6ICX9_9HYPH|nr:tail fiber domain-containing protein [Microvirga flocculans]MBB4039099.1 hypothetical protein [Microvirga flocculans]